MKIDTFDMVPNPHQNPVPSTHQLLRQLSRTQVLVHLVGVHQETVNLRVHTGLLSHLGGRPVHQLGQGRGQQDPRVATDVDVPLVPTVHNPWNIGRGVSSVDGVLAAEEGAEYLHGPQNLLGQRAKNTVVQVPHIERINHSTIQRSIRCLRHVLPGPVARQRCGYLVSDLLVLGGQRRLPELLRQGGTHCQRGPRGKAPPEEIRRLVVLPEVAGVVLPVLHQPSQVLLHQGLRASEDLSLHPVQALQIILVKQPQGVPRHSQRPQCRPVLLGAAPAPGEWNSAGDGVLGLGEDINAIGVFLILNLGHPLHVILEGCLHIRLVWVSAAHSLHGEGPIPLPVKQVGSLIPARIG
mmetsp:Transcript_1433/g.2900  ORF Transcript_1433/g.2900 Transcript_1433/m.2900 type:complete len:352 (-) Transcript_1433:334-1389(-)